MHLSLHLRDSYIMYGPAPVHWSFAFERLNGIMSSKFRSNRNDAEEIMNRYVREQHLVRLSLRIIDDETNGCASSSSISLSSRTPSSVPTSSPSSSSSVQLPSSPSASSPSTLSLSSSSSASQLSSTSFESTTSFTSDQRQQCVQYIKKMITIDDSVPMADTYKKQLRQITNNSDYIVKGCELLTDFASKTMHILPSHSHLYDELSVHYKRVYGEKFIESDMTRLIYMTDYASLGDEVYGTAGTYTSRSRSIFFRLSCKHVCLT